ncbi:DUF317 domain-containing protein [Streptomyces nigrescens]
MNDSSTDEGSYTEGLQVTPRHLAGGGDPRYVTVPLRHGLCWKPTADPLVPHVQLTSPDGTSELTLAPSADGDRWWRLITRPPTGDALPWQVEFDAHTPVEFIAAYVDALTRIRPPTDNGPFAVLETAGWFPDGASPRAVTSRDGLCEVEYTADDIDATWWMHTTVPLPDEHHLWSAYFSSHTPPHLISAFAAALAGPTPLPRAKTAVPYGCRPLVAATSTSTWLSDAQLDKRITARTTAVRNAARRASRAAAAQARASHALAPRQVPTPRRSR